MTSSDQGGPSAPSLKHRYVVPVVREIHPRDRVGADAAVRPREDGDAPKTTGSAA
jgi:hypothetical protein